jgi:hypothetical protein
MKLSVSASKRFKVTQHSSKDYTKALSVQNQLIKSQLDAEETDTEELLALVANREKLVNQCLASLVGEEKKQFAEQELENNKDFTARTEALFSNSRQSLSKFVKDAKAVRKYR